MIFKYFNLFKKRKDFIHRYGKNSWALVTGGTDGIGKAYCQELAKEGLNIIIVSRNLEKLKKTSEELKNSFKNIEVDYIQFDFNEKTSIEDYIKVFGNLTKIFDISFLVNNVGSYHLSEFSNLKFEGIREEINLNVIPTASLTNLFLDHLVKRNNKSAIINVSSFACIRPIKELVMYSSTKSFVYFFSIALAEEHKNSNLDILVHKPIFVETKLSGKKADGIFCITPFQTVNAALNELGFKKETYGYVSHKVLALFMKLMPKFLFHKMKKLMIKLTPNLDQSNKKS